MSEQIKKALLLNETGQQIVEVLNRIAEKQIELATTLAGNDADKAPSVKAANDELIKKVDKTSIAQNLEGQEEDKVPSVKAVKEGLDEVLEKIPLPDWAQDNEDDKGYIVNKPAIKSGIGENSVIENNGSYAGGINSSVCGTSTEAHGDGSRAEGILSRAYGHHSHAEGMETKAYGYRSHTEGCGTTTGKEGRNGSLDEGAHAEGRNTHAYGQGAHTEGVENTAEGNGSHAEGGYTYAQYAYSHAEGYGVYTTMQYQHAQGKFNVKDKNNNYAHIVGNGYDNNHRSNAHTLDWNGNAWFAGDIKIGGTDYNSGQKLLTQADKEALETAIARASGENTITRKVTGRDDHIYPTNPYGKGYFSKVSGATYQMPDVANRDNLSIKKYEEISGENQILAEGNTITLNGSLNPGTITLELEEPLISDVQDISVTMSMSGSFLGEAEDGYSVDWFNIYFNNNNNNSDDWFHIPNSSDQKEITIDRELNTISLRFSESVQMDQDKWLDISYTFNNFTITFTITCMYYVNTYTYWPLKAISVFDSDSSWVLQPISPQLQALPEFGLVKSNTVYNYIDFDNKKYYQNCTLNDDRTEIIQISTREIDISDILKDEDGIVDLTDASRVALMVGPLDDDSHWSDLCIYEFNYKSKIE